MTSPRRPPGSPITRRDSAGIQRSAPSWESLTERLIREAQEAGRFDRLPGHGRPLHLEADSLAGDQATAYHLLRNANLVPAWIETDREIRLLRDRIEDLLARATRATTLTAAWLDSELERLVDDHDDAVRRLEELAPTPRQHRQRLDRPALRSRLCDALGARAIDHRPTRVPDPR